MSTWYMTVGVPGGEYAVKAENLGVARQIIIADYTSYEAQALDGLGREDTLPHVRSCPPELAEWIEAIPFRSTRLIDEDDSRYRFRVNGGWMHNWGQNSPNGGRSDTETFVPVAGAAGLTILTEQS